MPPKGAKRSRSSSSTPHDAAATAPLVTPSKLIGNRVTGKLKRSPEVLDALAEKKSKESIWDSVIPFQRRTSDSDFDAANMMKFMTWNVAGLRGLLNKNDKCLKELLEKEKPDVLCLQETKLNPSDAEANAVLGTVDGYTFVDHPCAVKKGYSGTRTYIRTETVSHRMHATHATGFGLTQHATPNQLEDGEGRVLTTLLHPYKTVSAAAAAPAECPTVALVNTYIPNSGMTLDRLPFRTETFDEQMRQHLSALDDLCIANAEKSKEAKVTPPPPSSHVTTTTTTTPAASAAVPDYFAGFIWTGDLNVAERDFDRYYSGKFKTMQECSGFTPEERWSFRKTLKDVKCRDSFRELYPISAPVYTFWSARLNGRSKGLGWRLDYFVVSQRLMPFVVDCFAMPEVMGSDHCPVQMWLRIP